MNSQGNNIINHASPKQPRNKSVDKHQTTSPLVKSNSINIVKPVQQRFTYNVLSHHSKPSHHLFHLKQPHQYHYEGDLSNLDKIKAYQPNIRTIPKNINKTQLNPFMKGVPLHLPKDNNTIKRHKLPRKSPIQCNRNYVKHGERNGVLPFVVNNFIYNNYLKANSSSSSGNCCGKMKSQIIRTKNEVLHLPVENHNGKQRITSKSPILNVSALFERFKKYKIIDYGNVYDNNNNNNNSNHKVNMNVRPKSSNAGCNDKAYNNDNSDSELLHQDNNNNVNEIHLYTHNIKQHNNNTNNDSISFNHGNNTNINNVSNNNTETKFQHSQCSAYKSKTEKTDTSAMNVSNTNNNDQLPNHTNNTTTNKINIDASPTTSNNNNSNKHLTRSHSQSAPNIMQDIINTSTTTNNNNNNNIPLIPLINKKIRSIYQFTHVGFDGEADKANNQDIAFIEQGFAGNPNYFFMSVCDGHGIEGHYVSGFIKKVLPKKMTRLLKDKNLQTPSPLEKSEIDKLITKGFRSSNNDLIRNVNVNSTFSGSTCVSVIFTPSKLISANIGDSRAVLGRYEDSKWMSYDLTRDHKPTERDEAERILNASGRIQPFVDEETGEFVGPQRVWIKDDDVPGLAMTRSFGDRVAATVGVHSDPEILEYELGERDKFVLIASDGVWEFISSEEVVNIVKEFYVKNDIKGCCEYLYSESKRRWMHEEEVVDDITMLLVFYDK